MSIILLIFTLCNSLIVFIFHFTIKTKILQIAVVWVWWYETEISISRHELHQITKASNGITVSTGQLCIPTLTFYSINLTLILIYSSVILWRNRPAKRRVIFHPSVALSRPIFCYTSHHKPPKPVFSMTIVLVRGNLASYSHKYPWRVLVSGLIG